MGLPKTHRLRRRQDFSRIYQQGVRFRSAHLTLRTLRRSPYQSHRHPHIDHQADNPSAGEFPTDNIQALATRLGVSISLKVDKRSVVRNRIRRQLQAIFQQLLPQVSPSWDLLIVVHPQAVQCDYPKFLQELKQLLLDAEVLNGH